MTAQRRPARRVRPFTPSQESPAVLSDRTVGRESTLEIMVDRLVDAARSGNRAHTMLIGPRGSGKTHLLNVALHRARQQIDVERRLVVVRFDEDAIGVHRYTDILAEAYAGVVAAGTRGPRLSDFPERDIADALGDRVLVLTIENADRIFKSLGMHGQQAFRAWVEHSRQVLVLASSPALFKGIQDRALPWWGNFGIHQLQELSLDEGRELLIKLAREGGDEELAEFLTTPKAEGRLRAINALAGGSPRVWMILAECLTVETLDELVPAVEALLEGLVPYYQQLLWDLSDVEQRLVRELSDGPHHAATVQELAAACEIDQRVAASTLKRLADMRWVRADKSPELDRRHSWYRLREPLVRHHFQYRSARDQPLPLIVELLKAWYDPEELRRYLFRALPGSEVERFVAASINDQVTSAIDYCEGNLQSLRVDARAWFHGAEALARDPDAGALIDIAVTAVLEGAPAALACLDRRRLTGRLAVSARLAIELASGSSPDQPATERLSCVLLFLSREQLGGRTGLVLSLISIMWDAASDWSVAAERLKRLVSDSPSDEKSLLTVEVEVLQGVALARAALAEEAAEQYRVAADRFDEFLGEPSAASARVRCWRIQALRQAKLQAQADGELRQLLPELRRLLGDEDELVLGSRVDVLLSQVSAEAADSRALRAEWAELAETCLLALGADHEMTLRVQLFSAAYLIQAGEAQRGTELALEMRGRQGSSDPRLGVEAVIAMGALLMIASGVRWPSEPIVTDSATIAELLLSVSAGSAEALMRLPEELADRVRSIRSDLTGAESSSP